MLFRSLGVSVVLASLAISWRAMADERPHRHVLDVELITIHAPLAKPQDGDVNSFLVIGYERVLGGGRSYVVPVAGGAAGFMEVQGRVGLLFDASPEASHGFIARIELRPTIAVLSGGALFTAVGVGYRFEGVAYILPVVEGGPVWLNGSCPEPDVAGRQAPCVPAHANGYLGGTLAFGARF